MRFRLLDRITQLEPGKRIEAVKQLTQADGYLEDHFPRFPIMPGVLMLEAMYQAAAWLVRKTENFAHSVVMLQDARTIKFSGFVKLGQTLVVTAEIKKQEGGETSLVTQGTVDGRVVASARLTVAVFQLADRFPEWVAGQDYLMRKMRQQFGRVMSGEPEAAVNVGLSMRWLWIDRFVEFVRGERAVAIKNVSLTEEPVSEYLPGFPVLPSSWVMEGLAWAGGILANDQRRFQERTVLAKIKKAVFHRPAFAGDQLRYTAVLEGLEPEGAFIRGTSHIGDELQAEVDIFLAHLGDRFEDVEGDLIDPADMLATLRLWRLYDVGRTASGEPLDVAERLLEGERQAQAVVERDQPIT